MNPSRKDMLQRPESTLNFSGFGIDFRAHHKYTARRKLRMLNNAQSIEDLKIPPSNRLEMLKGNRKGEFSIRINVQWRICFTWAHGNCDHVEIVDYH